MVSCCVPFCKSTTKKGSKFKRKAYEFPSNAEMRNKWIRTISRKSDDGKKLWQPGPSGRDSVCELHFTEDDFKSGLKLRRLKPEAVPSIFPGYPSYKQPIKKCRSPPKKRMLQIDKPQIKQEIPSETTNNKIAPEEQETNNTNQENSKNTSLLNKDQICSIFGEENITTNGQKTNIRKTKRGNSKKKTSVSIRRKINRAVTEDSIITEKQSTNIGSTNQGNCKNVSLLDKHGTHSTVIEDNIITDGQATNTGNINHEHSKHAPLLDKHEICSAFAEDNITIDEQETNVGNTNQENTPPCLSFEKQASPPLEKLLAKKRSQVSRLKRKIKQLEHQLQIKGNVLCDPLIKNIFCIQNKSQEGDKSAIFLLELLNNHGKVRRQWSDVTIRNCLVWRKYYGKGYEFARQNNLLHLPSRSTLKKVLNSTTVESGISFPVEQSDVRESGIASVAEKIN